MTYSQFLGMALVVGLETYFFNWALIQEYYLLAGFLLYLLYKHFRVVALMDKMAGKIRQMIQDKEKDQ